jgi:hypothetical protein
MNVRCLTNEQLRDVLRIDIAAQQEWSRSLELVIYRGREAPAGFVRYGKRLIEEHQQRVEYIEMELERRARVEICHAFIEVVRSRYETGVQ